MTPGVQQAIELGLTTSEYEQITKLLMREPNEVELAVFSLLWSEHCAYKHSKKLLKTLPTDGAHVVMGPGENAGVVDLGNDRVLSFKVESHNHPSAVEPFQGAATGVGGILRDIAAVGTRPIAVLNSLRFGELSSARSRYLLEHAVAGIGHYGNSVGVPTIGGEIYFEESYEQNCLINAMALGLSSRDRLVRCAASGPGNAVILFGARTGRDGIGGASVLASAELDDADLEKRPSVQVGDPFAGSKLIECSFELLERGLLVALQDLGAAGLSSSCAEMASQGSVGIDLQVDRVPLREANMQPFEIMVSESQERMLCVVKPEQIEAVLAVCSRWQLAAAQIGTVTTTNQLRVFHKGQMVGDMPVSALVDECPLYDLNPQRPEQPLYTASAVQLDATLSLRDTLLQLLSCANIASRRPVFEQYDCLVQSRTVRRPQEADAAVLALPEGDAIAVTIDGNGRRVACDPYQGTLQAVFEGVANLACVGAQPIGLTNCLNFGNPEKPHIAWQLSESIRGLGDACRHLEIPVVGGNVSLYNESRDGAIYPTPVVGLVGSLPDANCVATSGFQHNGDAVGFAGSFFPELAGSELEKLRGEPFPNALEPFDLGAAQKATAVIREAVRAGRVRSAHDVSSGGFLVALAEACIAGGRGAELHVDTAPENLPLDQLMFGEGVAGFVLSGTRAELERLAGEIAINIVGVVGGDTLRLNYGDEQFAWSLAELSASNESVFDFTAVD